MSAQADAFSSWLVGWLIIAEVVEVLEAVPRFVLVLRVPVGLQVLLGGLGVSRVGVAPVLFSFWFLKFVEEIDCVSELFL